MTITSMFSADPKPMRVEVFTGGTGDLVLKQEIPSIEFGERYLRIRIRPEHVDALLRAIEATRRGAA